MAARRTHEVRVALNDDEFARLEEIRPLGVSRSAFIRSLVRGDPQDPDVASRAEALSILTSLAREGRTSAAIALVRELRSNDQATIDDEIDRILGG
jgi:hypothetical protein